MLNTASAEKLAAILDQFSVPMFAAERASKKGDFQLVCMNRARAEATGFEPGAARGRALRDLLPAHQADIVIGRYAECTRTQSPQRYLETLTLPGGVQTWDTTIQPIRLASGADRVIGTAIQVADNVPPSGSQIVYDDIRYFSALADMQLQNLLSMFEAARDQGLFNDDSASRINRLCCVCRSVQRSVEDIRETVRRANSELKGTPDGSEDSCGNILRVLNETTCADS
ncbi:PAS domain-containing protein [Roseobacter sinensis]|uniref:PAS domain-containing protein n=1 Tax=Roseobacter sinensis TaxID=2931391 RepID=A0ABT3B948_9RHOB|nr:PAS domain-containing protein [Roseobacter sp. WL0113]MCV3270091.1 PAS domain-containing protein [Roseobacter sp. WL0113]